MIIIKKLLKSYVWLVPFLVFFIAFFISFLSLSQEKRTVPSLLYLPVTQGLELLAHQQLNCRLLKEQESTWPAGTIISQSPQPGKHLKAFQTVFITLAKPIPDLPVPCAVGLSRTQAKTIFNPSYKVKWYPVYSPDIAHQCIAQITHGEDIILYESTTSSQYVLMPSFYKKRVSECIEFLKKYSITPTIIHSHSINSKHVCTQCYVNEQNPAAGTIICLNNPPIIQLKV